MKRTSQDNWAIELKSPREISALRDAGRIVAQVFARLAEAVHPGISLRELDRPGDRLSQEPGRAAALQGLSRQPAYPSAFPGVICTSVNNEICHGLPDKRMLCESDMSP